MPDATNRRLSSKQLVEDFGRKTTMAREGAQAFYAALTNPANDAVAGIFSRWLILAKDTYGQQATRFGAAAELLADWLAVQTDGLDAMALLFAVQTYYALVVKTLIGQVHPALDSCPLEISFDWPARAHTAAVDRARGSIARRCGSYNLGDWLTDTPGSRDLFKGLYEDLFPKRLRHALGEYYTPDWLAEHVLDQSGYTGQPEARLLDPACGSGTFLVAAIRRLRQRFGPSDGQSTSSKRDLCQRIVQNIVGFDLNPLAVLSARANYLLALGGLADHLGTMEIPVYHRDSILAPKATGPGDERFDYIVGNPPWIAWDDLPGDYREATKPLWEQYGLFSLSASEARHGGGKKDLSMLMVYRAADAYLATGGRLAMVITQTLFQTKGAGDGFRRFRLGNDGLPLRVVRVDDMVELKPFAAANWTSTLVLEKGVPTIYPIPYIYWTGKPSTARGSAATLRQIAYEAEPVDPQLPTSPWFLRPAGFGAKISQLMGPSDYEAHLGANTGGANGIFWLQVLGSADGGLRVRNLVASARKREGGANEVETVLEPSHLYPLLRWNDVARYTATPSAHLLMPQDPKTRRGIAEDVLRQKCPRTHAYLKQFEPLLVRRAAYRRYQQQGPFYSMYDIDHYTLAPIKVVWRRMDRRINAAVVEPWQDGLLGLRPVVPQETCVLIACESSEEAHYLCALLNSAIVGFLVGSHSVRGGKGFGTPGMLRVLRLRRFEPADALHLELAALGRQAHAAVRAGQDVLSIESQIDTLAARLWGLQESDLAIIATHRQSTKHPA